MFYWVKRVFLFLLINFFVILTISSILSIFNIQPYLTANGLDLKSLIIFCSIWGMGGAFISLQLSRKIAKWMLGVKLINMDKPNTQERFLIRAIEHLSKQAGLLNTPQIGIFNSNTMNAFATGPSKKRSLVAVSTGLLNHMDPSEIEAVLAHEITHISNGDMVTMTLIQGVVNVFVMFFARIFSYALTMTMRGHNQRSSFISYYLMTFLFEIIFMVLGSIIVSWFSRWREFRADHGAAMLTSKEKMIQALKTLETFSQDQVPLNKRNPVHTMMISNVRAKGASRLFSSHPPLALRIRRLQLLL